MKKAVFAGNLQIGGGAPVSVQSMTNTRTEDAEATLAQIHQLAEAGCDLVRVSVYNEACVAAVRQLVDNSPVPLCADIHFDARLAVGAVENGISKLRINPGNIGGEDKVRLVADCLKRHHIPVRIGEGGKLFGSVTGKDVSDALKKQNIDIDKKKISIKGTVTGTGAYEAVIKVHPAITSTVKVNIVAE